MLKSKFLIQSNHTSIFLGLIIALIYTLLLLSSCKNRNTVDQGSPIKQNEFGIIREPVRDNNHLYEIDLTNSFMDTKSSSFDFTQLLDDYKLIFLETIESSIIGEIKKVIVVDSFILVLDPFVAKSLYIFRDDGKFVRQIGNTGRGPGEYIEPTDCHYDKEKNLIVIYDQFKSEFLYYDFDNNYLGNKKFFFRFIQFASIGNEYVYRILLDNSHLKELNDYSLFIGTDTLPIKYACLPKFRFKLANGLLYNINDTIAVYGMPFCDTIYHYTHGTLLPRYYIKFNPRTRLPKNFDKNIQYDYHKFRKRYTSDQYTYFNGDFLETDDYLYFSISHNTGHLFYYHKDTKILYGGANFLVNRDYTLIRMLMFYGRPISHSGKYFISPIDADRIFSYLKFTEENIKKQLLQHHPALENLKIEDNPVLFFFKLK